jgi:hypothetical protein
VVDVEVSPDDVPEDIAVTGEDDPEVVACEEVRVTAAAAVGGAAPIDPTVRAGLELAPAEDGRCRAGLGTATR